MPKPYVDDSVGFREARPYFDPPRPVTNEGSFFQTEDGTLHMMLRTDETGYLWHTQSTDDGVNWSDPGKTEFTDSTAKFHFGRLPDGRLHYVGNPSTERWYRTLFVLALSAAKTGPTPIFCATKRQSLFSRERTRTSVINILTR
jgi:hypothetical protein